MKVQVAALVAWWSPFWFYGGLKWSSRCLTKCILNESSRGSECVCINSRLYWLDDRCLKKFYLFGAPKLGNCGYTTTCFDGYCCRSWSSYRNAFIKESNLRFYSNHGVNLSFSLGKCGNHRTHLSFVLFSPFLLFLPFIFLFGFRRNVIGVIVFSYTD